MESEYCECKKSSSVYNAEDSKGFGSWDVCSDCNKRLESSYIPYDHYDGEDHCEY
ncbi:hypothetical protein [Clostridium sp. HBUAS56017]|uniref:hypothetical protein n=1 Tax=Clostridium sp. HBUAS56017 TaxID=2571128 RepID=UPI00163DDCBC|nr:hypothetical protein [Clostridium sp. HBUAS56017]